MLLLSVELKLDVLDLYFFIFYNLAALCFRSELVY